MFGDGRWKVWLASAAFALVIAFVLHQFRTSFISHPPDWMQLHEHASQRLPDLHEVRSYWFQFAQLLGSARAAADSQQTANYTIRVIEPRNDVHNSTVWWGEPILNEGFDPMPNIERQLWIDPSHLLGYYNTDGTPLGFATRKMPTGGNLIIATVHADKPIPSGARMFLIRRELSIDKKATDTKGQRTIGLGNLRYNPGRVEARGVFLPPHATLTSYAPEGSAIVFPSAPILVAWLSTDLVTNKIPLSVTFTPH